MDVEELLDYKPPQALKRPVQVDEEEDEAERTRKMRRLARAKASRMARPISPTPSTQPLDHISEEERAEILKFVETEQTQGEIIDETALKKIVLNFEKRSLKNREMRIKFPDSPEKFLESEVELHEILQEMRILATAPDYYPLLIKLQVIPSLLELLSHDNTDIAVSIIRKTCVCIVYSLLGQ
uniref:Beta-catenin-like protein 1 n=1 Tax=Diabrotica virgifera virgifera TaxID=50390 RepID=A0A6P7GU62_DIAVI